LFEKRSRSPTKVPRTMLIVNKVPSVFDSAAVKAQVEQTYNCPVATVLPHSNEMMALASAGIFVLLFLVVVLTQSCKSKATQFCQGWLFADWLTTAALQLHEKMWKLPICPLVRSISADRWL